MGRKKNDKHGKSKKKEKKLDEANQNSGDNFTNIDAISLEHAVSKLQDSIKKIITESPTLDELESYIFKLTGFKDKSTSDPELSSAIVTLARSQKVHLAAKLKSLHDKKELKLFDQIANFDENTQLEDASNIEIALRQTTEAVPSDFKQQSLVSTYPPPIPEITDPVIKARVFTHRSEVNNLKFLSKEAAVHSHNERLEFLGDTLLGTAITYILFERYPNANEGELSTYRSRLVNNATLSEFSKLYKLDQNLKFGSKNSKQFKTGKLKIIADVFEAYIGGVYSCGKDFNAIKDWLFELVKPKLELFEKFNDINNTEGSNYTKLLAKPTKEIEETTATTTTPTDNDEEEPLNKNAKVELYALIGSASARPAYVTKVQGDGQGKPFIIECKMNDEVIGTGSGRSSNIGGNRAAMNALKNRDFIQKYNTMRLKTPREQSKRAREDDNEVDDAKSNSPKKQQLSAVPVLGLVLPDDKDVVAENVILPAQVRSTDDQIDYEAKGKLYQYLASKKILPNYRFESCNPMNPQELKITLIINDVPVCYCISKNKKRGTHHCAAFMLKNPHLFKRCYVF